MQNDMPRHIRTTRASANGQGVGKPKVRRLLRLRHIAPISHEQQLALIEEARAARGASRPEETDHRP